MGTAAVPSVAGNSVRDQGPAGGGSAGSSGGITGTTAAAVIAAAAAAPAAVSASSAAAAAAAAASHVPFWKKIVFSGVSGAVATTVIYPLDITKTKLQDQRGGSSVGGRMYSGPLDCALKILRSEGLPGMFRGWPPNVLLVMPEKALKITANDALRSSLWQGPSETMPVSRQVLAGGLAGFIQVIVTNPMELLKIQGATMKDKFAKGEIPRIKSYTELARELGFVGLYTGVVSTWMRDVPFSFIYFPMYAEVLRYLKSRYAAPSSPSSSTRSGSGVNHTALAFSAGTAAGTIAAGLTTPLDVIKTRVHSAAATSVLESQSTGLSGFFSAELSRVSTTASSILHQEGPGAFWKGVLPRVLIISPLFGITMTCYETLVSVFASPTKP
uniref:Mitochondrial carrier protein n=1 Tax=Erythrolobus madagascarensis TaxID=708628 RepID=A0A7S0XK00_9RHOD|mmetsp:Transcript_4810/g.10278  ORF Transcript_4810/g.10278 Transcript_4810/m.10278 type:complete len:385 (+) Transcript_4810:150-1304(+)|eukprot:CAMPEP_0185844516 /NCGR_PEP_ID=MMETSP1354-20130828/648_1 /TAXON_ID=708628 /ORGANISM="Erythrolobus madagascarensis, Strain CCMP3276" /LENGTH=384 /DNA_ID=CAMNT_0028544189 /DNA_START=148 /DNA_END=1302 /DNA_ORIENTATION=+